MELQFITQAFSSYKLNSEWLIAKVCYNDKSLKMSSLIKYILKMNSHIHTCTHTHTHRPIEVIITILWLLMLHYSCLVILVIIFTPRKKKRPQKTSLSYMFFYSR